MSEIPRKFSHNIFDMPREFHCMSTADAINLIVEKLHEVLHIPKGYVAESIDRELQLILVKTEGLENYIRVPNDEYRTSLSNIIYMLTMKQPSLKQYSKIHKLSDKYFPAGSDKRLKYHFDRDETMSIFQRSKNIDHSEEAFASLISDIRNLKAYNSDMDI